MPEIGRHDTQIGHRHLVAAADIDATQQREIPRHPTSLPPGAGAKRLSGHMSGNVPREPVYCELVLADWVERVSHRAERDSTSSPHDLHPVGKCRLSAIP